MIEGLKDVKRIVTHKNCPDGIASAMICHAVLPDAAVQFVMYGEEEYEQLKAEEGMLFVDIIPPAARAQEFADAGAIVLDHHQHAKIVVWLFGDRGRFADETDEPGVSGALLAYEHVWRPLRSLNDGLFNSNDVREFAEWTGIRDTWQRESQNWDRACAQAEALRLFGYEGLQDGPPWLGGEEMAAGWALLKRNRKAARSSAERAYVLGRFAFTNERHASDFAESLRELNSPAEVAVSFMFIGQDDGSMQLVYSLRTIRGDTDVGAIAKRNGGGGHTKAAGFHVTNWAGDNPVALFMSLVE